MDDFAEGHLAQSIPYGLNKDARRQSTNFGVQTGVQLARFLAAKIGLNGAESTVS